MPRKPEPQDAPGASHLESGVFAQTLFLSDLDGTLLGPDAALSAFARDTLNRLIARGLRFSVATARTAATTLHILAGLNLTVPIALMNGALIYDPQRARYERVLYLPPETVALMLEALRERGVTGLLYEQKDDCLTTYYESLDAKPIRDFVEERAARYGKRFEQAGSFSELSLDHVVYFVLIDAQERLAPVREALAPIPGLQQMMYKDNYSPDLWYLEIFSTQASKRNAALYLKEARGFTRLVGFGDNLNDLSLFEACDHRLAVGNAHAEVKAAADQVIETNERDGVPRWIEHHVLSPLR